MFEGFEQKRDQQARKRLFASTGTSIGLCVVLVVVITAMATQHKPRRRPQPVAVSFHRPPTAPKKPLPKPPAPRPKPKAPGVKIESNANTNAVIPTAVPKDALAEGDEADFRVQGSIANIAGTAVGRVGGSGPPGTDDIERMTVLPDGAEPPQALSQNATPPYPEAARKAGKEGLVVLKVVITTEGRVTDIKVVSGEEPFLAAAIAMVKTWRYEPARLDGRSIEAARLIRIPFRLNQ